MTPWSFELSILSNIFMVLTFLFGTLIQFNWKTLVQTVATLQTYIHSILPIKSACHYLEVNWSNIGSVNAKVGTQPHDTVKTHYIRSVCIILVCKSQGETLQSGFRAPSHPTCTMESNTAGPSQRQGPFFWWFRVPMLYVVMSRSG